MKKLKPREAKTFKQICSLKTDSKSIKKGWICIDERNVYLVNQLLGEQATGKVTFSRKEFAALIDWYNKEQEII